MIWLRVAVALCAWAALPAVSLAALACRHRRPNDTIERFLALATTLGLSIWMLLAAVLALLGGVSIGPVVVIGIVLAAGSIALLVGPARPGLSVMTDSSGALGVAASYGVSTLVATSLLVSIFSRTDSLREPTPWYYWQLVRETVLAHGVPAFSLEWGRHVPFLDDFPGFTAGSAILSVAGGDPLRFAAADVLQVIAILTAGAGMYLLARAWGATRFGGSLAVGLFFALDLYVVKLSSLRPEAAAYGLAFVVAALAKRWIDDRSRVDLGVAGLGLLVLPLVHPVVWVLTLGLVGGTALVGLSRARRPRALMLVGTALVAGTVGAGVFGNSLGGASKLGGLPATTLGRIDPTWIFQNRVSVGLLGVTRPSNSSMALASFRRGFLGLGWQWHVSLAGLALLAFLVTAAVGNTESRGRARRLLTFAAGSVVAVLLVSALFARAWNTYVPNRTGVGRLLPLAWFLLPLLLGVGLSFLRNRALRAIVTSAASVMVVALLVHGLPTQRRYGSQQPGAASLAALTRLDLPRGSLVLSNGYTEGVLRFAVGSPGLLEGRAPYTEQRLLHRANVLLASATKFFSSPDPSRPIPGHGVTHLLVATGHGWTLTTPYVMTTNLDLLDRRPDLTLETVGPGWRLYRVKPAG